MSVNPYESPHNPSQPRVRRVDERAIEKQLRPWLLGGVFLAMLATPFFAMYLFAGTETPIGAIGFCFGLGIGVVLFFCVFIVKPFLIRLAPTLTEEDDDDWLPK